MEEADGLVCSKSKSKNKSLNRRSLIHDHADLMVTTELELPLSSPPDTPRPNGPPPRSKSKVMDVDAKQKRRKKKSKRTEGHNQLAPQMVDVVAQSTDDLVPQPMPDDADTSSIQIITDEFTQNEPVVKQQPTPGIKSKSKKRIKSKKKAISKVEPRDDVELLVIMDASDDIQVNSTSQSTATKTLNSSETAVAMEQSAITENLDQLKPNDIDSQTSPTTTISGDGINPIKQRVKKKSKKSKKKAHAPADAARNPAIIMNIDLENGIIKLDPEYSQLHNTVAQIDQDELEPVVEAITNDTAVTPRTKSKKIKKKSKKKVHAAATSDPIMVIDPVATDSDHLYKPNLSTNEDQCETVPEPAKKSKAKSKKKKKHLTRVSDEQLKINPDVFDDIPNHQDETPMINQKINGTNYCMTIYKINNYN